MKPSSRKLGQALQLFLLRRGYQIEDLAREMGITAEGLSNLIHGRRRFKDETLLKLSSTRILQQGGFSHEKLKAYRAMDEYGLSELVMALLEYLKSGETHRLPEIFAEQLDQELKENRSLAGLLDKKQLLFSLLNLPESQNIEPTKLLIRETSSEVEPTA